MTSTPKLRGFTTTPNSMSAEFSWEAQQRRDNDTRQKLQIEQQRREEQQHWIVKQMEDQQRAEQQRWEEQRRADERRTETDRIRANIPPEFQGDPNNRVILPKYTFPQTAANDLRAADKFDPLQTLFRYDHEALNIVARQEFYNDAGNAGKPFTLPHASTVYEGLTHRDGVDGLGRAWNSATNNKSREYLFDMREYNEKISAVVQEKLEKGEAVAIRQVYAIPGDVDRISSASIAPWKADQSFDDQQRRKVRMSRTTGGGEQIIGNPKYFKFNTPRP